MRHAVEVLSEYVARGIPVVGVEPSCLASLRSDARELAGAAGEDDATLVACGVFTLAELLSRLPGWDPPDLTGTEIVVQPHCHHAAVLGWDEDERLLASEEGKKLSSKERRQLRNKVSARAFRSRRKGKLPRPHYMCNID